MTKDFEYNKCNLDLGNKYEYREKNIKIKRIHLVETNTILPSINHRPIQRSHVNSIKSNFIGIDLIDPIFVVYSREINAYYIMDHQNLFQAVIELIYEGKITNIKRIKCSVLYNKTTGLKSHAEDITKDASKISYCRNSGQKGVSFSDNIKAIHDLGIEYLLKRGKREEGLYDYLFNNQYGIQKYKKRYVEYLWKLGENLMEKGLMHKAQEGRWNARMIKEQLSNTKSKTTMNVNITIFKDQFEKIKEQKNNPMFWKVIMSDEHEI